MKVNIGDKLARSIVNLIMIVVGLFCLLPVLNIFARSLSSLKAVAANEVLFWPVEFSLAGWEYIVERTIYLKALGNTVFITFCGTLIAVVITTLTAYSLSHRRLRGYRLFVGVYVGIMLFHAGILPNYFQVQAYGLLNSLWALILPAVISSHYMFVLKKNMESIPDSLEEAALIDGASYSRILFSVVFPVSKASIATITVFFSVHFWNKYFDALLYITKPSLKPITLFLYELIHAVGMTEGRGDVELLSTISQDIINASAVILTIAPILVIYPFMQRYFVRGTLSGAIKG
ncbi:MAG: carbohydrate ABC transporter permease [Treponema sp.]|nr:carbohydrate ABC transporter permease [Treponema sp.]